MRSGWLALVCSAAEVGVRLVAAMLAPALVVGAANLVWGPRPREAELLNCELTGLDSGTPQVETTILNRAAGWLWEDFRLGVIVEGLDPPIATSTGPKPIWRGATANVAIPLRVPPGADLLKTKIDCLLFPASERSDDPTSALKRALDRRTRPYGLWDDRRLIVFVSGIGTEANVRRHGVGFPGLYHHLTENLGASGYPRHIEFSYSGNYQAPGSDAALALLDEEVNAPSPEFVPGDVCLGAAAASRRLRTLLDRASPHTEFVVIGHSFGGVVASHFLATLLMEDPDGSLARRIHSVITLDSPVLGYPTANPISGVQVSLLARALGCDEDSQAAADVIQGSGILERIASLSTLNRRTHYITVSNDHDLMVPAAISHVSSSERHVANRSCLDLISMDLFSHGCVLDDPALGSRLADLTRRPWLGSEGDDDHGSTPEDATALTWDDTFGEGSRPIVEPGMLETTGDRDVFAMPITAGEFYLVYVRGRTNVDVQLTVRDPTGSQSLSNDDFSYSVSGVALLDFVAYKDGEVLLEVTTSHLSPSAIGPYVLFAQAFPPER